MAIVASDHLSYGPAGMYESFADIEELPVEYGSFRTVEAAMGWLGVETNRHS